MESNGMGLEGSLHYSDDESLPDVVEALASLDREGEYWDFKREWHHSKADLVHDIINLANNRHGETALLVIGIDEKSGYSLLDVYSSPNTRRNTQQLNDLLKDAAWADAWPDVRVVPLAFDYWPFGGAGTVDVVLISPDEDAVPYYLTRDYGKEGRVRAGAVYVRHQDGNTAVDRTATALETERLWRRHFGIDRTPMERVVGLLMHPEDWEDTYSTLGAEEGNRDYAYYHKLFPEFTLSHRKSEERNAWEPLMLAATMNHSADWWDYEVYYYQTRLYSGTGFYSDYHYIPLANFCTLDLSDSMGLDEQGLCPLIPSYYDGSIEQAVELFMHGREGTESDLAHSRAMKMIPIFESEEEKKAFESWIQPQWDEVKRRAEAEDAPFYANGAPEELKESLAQQARIATVAVEYLNEWRLARTSGPLPTTAW